MDYTTEFNKLIQGVSKIIGKPISRSDYEILDRGIPHTHPPRLPRGKMAVYAFIYNGIFLKIGRANRKSHARFASQHYSHNAAKSTLAKSILNDNTFAVHKIHEDEVNNWIKQNCRRIDVLINENLGHFALELIESILHYRYEPKYEGFKSQR